MSKEIDFDLAPEDQTEPPVMSDEERAALFDAPHTTEEDQIPATEEPNNQEPSGEETSAQSTGEESPNTEEEDGDENTVKMVPHQALHAEREERKKLQEQLSAQQQRFDEFVARMATAKLESNEQEEPQVPEFDEDPAENLNARLAQQEQTQKALLEAQKAQSEQAQQQAQLANFQADFQVKEANFASQNPDYYQATEFLRQSRVEELKMLGFTEAQAMQSVEIEAWQYAVTASKQGVDPVEMFYTVAKQRGYKGANNGTPDGAPQPSVSELKENMSRAESMGPSGSSPKSITLADLANMSDSEFDKATSGEAWEQLWS